MVLSPRTAAALLLLALAPVATASAQTTNMDVSTLSYNNYDPMPQTFGDHAGLDVSNYTRSGFGNTSTVCPSVSLWGPGYSTMSGAAFACNDGLVGEIFLQALSGGVVKLNSIDIGSYLNGPTRTFDLRLYDNAWNLVGGTSGNVSSTLTFFGPATSYSELHVQWGTDWNTGVNNINTTVSTAVVATPEPASLALFATGLVGFVAIRRRRA